MTMMVMFADFVHFCTKCGFLSGNLGIPEIFAYSNSKRHIFARLRVFWAI